MTSAADIDSKVTPAPLIVQADGVVVFAYPGKAGGCGPQLVALLEELADSLPVLVIQPETSDSNDLAGFEGKVSKVESVSSDPGQSQNAAVMSAMRELGIQAPILILLNPLFIPFWERAFGAYRLFAVSEQFRDKTEKRANEESEKEVEREKENQILLLERSVDSILVEGDEDLEWMRQEFVYHGESHRTKNFIKSAHSSLLELSKEALSAQSRYPHRLDILILIDGPEGGQSQTAGWDVGLYHRGSRHHVYLGLKQSNEELTADADAPDFGGFDVLLIDQSGDPQATKNMGKRFIDGVKEFRGLKGLVIENEADSALEEIAADWGVQVMVSKNDAGKQDERVSELDALFSSLMPGLPNWQLHQAEKYLSHEAWTYKQLVKKDADGEFSMKGRTDPIEELELLKEEKQKFESELDDMRKKIADQDQKILVLKEKEHVLKQKAISREEKKSNPGFFRKLALKIKGKR